MSGTREDLVKAIKDAARDHPNEVKEALKKQAESEKSRGSK